MTAEDALLELLAQLKAHNYHFTAVTPETHARVLARPTPCSLTLRDIFGWSRPFKAGAIDPLILDLMRRADAVEEREEYLRSRLRVATLNDRLFLHSAFPTTAADSVFFGPDTYRFCSFLLSELSELPAPTWIVDMGCGSGVGGIVAAGRTPAARLTMIDTNPTAVSLARVNARFAGVSAEVICADSITAGCDLAIANPPYMVDREHRTYRDGGGLFGGEVALDWARQAFRSLRADGTFLLYTGAAIVDGTSPLFSALAGLANDEGAEVIHREIEVDVFGEELARSEYAEVERISVLGCRLSRCGRKPAVRELTRTRSDSGLRTGGSP